MTRQPHQQRTEEHIPYAKALARKVRQQIGLPSRVDQSELEGWALLGLAEASKRFDQDRGVSFSTFAYRRIVGAVLNGIGKMHDVPSGSRSKARRSARIQEALPQSSETVSPEQAINDAEHRVRVVLGLDAVSGVAPQSQDDPYFTVSHNEELCCMREAIDRLPAKLRGIVEYYHLQGQSMAEVARSIGSSPATVCRLNKKALDLLANFMGGGSSVAC